MNRYEKVGTLFPGNLGASAQRYVVVAASHQFPSVPGFSVEQGIEVLRNLQHHLLLVDLTHADGARIFSAVSGIDGDHEATQTAFRHTHTLLWRGSLAVQIDDQPMPVRGDRLQGERVGPHDTVDIEDYPEVLTAAHRRAERPNRGAVDADLPELQSVARRRVIEIQHHPWRVFERKHAIAHRCGGVEHHPGVIRRLVHAHPLDGYGGASRPHRRGKQDGARQQPDSLSGDRAGPRFQRPAYRAGSRCAR